MSSTNALDRLGARTAAALLASTFTVTAMAADLFLRSGYVESDGEQIYFEVVGEGDTVVLTHGGGGTHAVWYQQVPVLAERCRVVTWDQRGFGRSTNTRGRAGPAAAAEDLGALLDHLMIDRAHVVGQSMGGWAAVGFALRYPERVRSLILADTLGGIPSPAVQQDDAFEQAANRPGPEQLPITRHPGLSDELGLRDPAKAFLYRQLGGASPTGARTSIRETIYDLDAVRQIEMPVLFIVGAQDETFPPSMIRAIAAQIEEAKVVEIPGAGHSPYFETPAAWNEAAMNFLATAARRR